MGAVALAQQSARAIENAAGGPLAILAGIDGSTRATDALERLHAGVRHVQAIDWLAESLRDTQFALGRVLNGEIDRWNRVGWPAEKARMWAALEWWVTEDDVMHMGRWLLNSAERCEWSKAEVAEVTAAMLDGWAWRLTRQG